MGDETENANSEFETLREQHNHMIDAYKNQNWKTLDDLIQVCRTLGKPYSLDVLYDLYEARRQEYTSNPPGKDWDGVFVAKSK